MLKFGYIESCTNNSTRLYQNSVVGRYILTALYELIAACMAI